VFGLNLNGVSAPNENSTGISIVSFGSFALKDRGAVTGLAIMLTSEVATLAGVEPFASWNTPICWTGFIIFADSIVYYARSRSWIRTAPREFIWLCIASIPLWLVFEFYNLFIRNWYYVGLPENPALQYFGYAWSYATIWPALFEGAELVAVLRRSGGSGASGNSGRSGGSGKSGGSSGSGPARSNLPVLSIALGIVMLILPLVVPTSVARYLAAPVWLGFIFLLDPIND
jgi:hypothetical protein